MQYVYATSDLGVASFLSTLGYRLEALNRLDPKRVEFCFLRDEQLDAAIEAYWKGTAKISPLALFTNQKILKHRLYDHI